jgi:hypothetical protein
MIWERVQGGLRGSGRRNERERVLASCKGGRREEAGPGGRVSASCEFMDSALFYSRDHNPNHHYLSNKQQSSAGSSK